MLLPLPSAWAQSPSNNARDSSKMSSSSITPAQIASIEANAKSVQDRLGPISGVDFNFTPESVKWLDGYIERTRSKIPDASGISQVLGSYLGEAMRRTYGCTWVGSEGQVALQCEPEFIVFPFNKVAKQFANGGEDSIFSFYETAGILLAEHRAKKATPKK
ncbi:hypothetical protein [Variovorax sp. GB1P17]|uniref:hypothetical protein n=1 Tax=Variovorax sp. GB1P17 TaxID=3443740 RepID=UPI003F4476EE